MHVNKIWVALSATAGVIAGGLLAGTPAMAAQKVCSINAGAGGTCRTGSLAASATHAITICAEGIQSQTLVVARDNDTGRDVGKVLSRTLRCTDIGGLYGAHYSVQGMGEVGAKAYISN
jgi:hypothetical protein